MIETGVSSISGCATGKTKRISVAQGKPLAFQDEEEPGFLGLHQTAARDKGESWREKKKDEKGYRIYI